MSIVIIPSAALLFKELSPDSKAVNAWIYVANLGTPRKGAGGFIYNGKLYIVGGVTPSGIVTTSVEIIDLATGERSYGEYMPEGRAHFGYTFGGNKFYVIGGIDNGGVPRKEIYSYDPGANSWTKETAELPKGIAYAPAVLYRVDIVSGPVEEPDFGCSGYNASVNNKVTDPDKTLAIDGEYGCLETHDGWTGQYEQAWLIYDFGRKISGNIRVRIRNMVVPHTGYCVDATFKIQYSSDGSSWVDGYSKRVTSEYDSGWMDITFTIDGARYIRIFQSSTTGCMGDLYTYIDGIAVDPPAYIPMIYLVGGLDENGDIIGDTYLIDVAGVTVTQKASMNHPRQNHACAELGGKIYCFGGDDGSQPMNSVEMYDPDTDTWTDLGSIMPEALSGLAAVKYNGKILIIGG